MKTIEFQSNILKYNFRADLFGWFGFQVKKEKNLFVL